MPYFDKFTTLINRIPELDKYTTPQFLDELESPLDPPRMKTFVKASQELEINEPLMKNHNQGLLPICFLFYN